MPLGIVSQEVYENDDAWKKIQEQIPLNEPPLERAPVEENKESESEVVEIQKGRGEGNTEVPMFLKKLIGESHIEEGSGAAQAIGKFLGLSQSSISAYAHGATSTATYNKPNEDLESHLLKTRNKITKRASGKLLLSLNKIDDRSLNDLSALEASTVAKNMAAIVKSMEPDHRYVHNQNNFNGPVITFYAPSLATEDKFPVIDVTE